MINCSVEFIIPTYHRPKQLKVILSSLVCQTDEDWKAIVVSDGESNEESRHVSNSFNDKRIQYMYINGPNRDWGHTPREYGKQLSSGEYIIMTGDDNYYVPTFVEEFKKNISSRPGMVYWDMVHSSFGYTCFICYPNNGQIDVGAYAIRNDLAKSIKLTTGYAADGQFIEDYKQKYPTERVVKINKILYVHN